MPNNITRRRFLTQSGRSVIAGGAAAASATLARAADSTPARANERVRLGWIGCGGRGHQLHQYFAKLPDIQVVGVCDVARSRAESLKKQAGGKAEVYDDFRKLLERKDLDAVIVPTTGHWHCLPTIHACQAGKDVYVEKPLAWSIGEGRMMVKAARKYDRIVYFGAQQRHMPHYQEAVEFIHSGKLGKISEVRSWNLENMAPNGFGNPPDSEPPADLNWDFWLGPAPKSPYNANRFNYHYWFWDYGGGWQSEWAVHMNDVTHWAMQADRPLSAAATGGKFARKDNTQLPDTFEVIYEYPDFIYLYSFRQGNAHRQEDIWYGNAFFGENGTLVINREIGWKVIPEPVAPNDPQLAGKLRMAAIAHPTAGEGPEGSNHQRAFIDAVKAHQRSDSSDVEIGHKSTIPGHLANISFRTGRKVHWDADKEQIKDDPAANKLLVRTYRQPWVLEV